MDPISAGNNPTNNPRLDLLHNNGGNQLVNSPESSGGAYGAGAFHARPSTQPQIMAMSAAKPQPSGPKKDKDAAPAGDAEAYVAAAKSKEAEAVPEPTTQPPTDNVPEPRTIPTTPGPNPRRPLFIGIVAIIILALIGAGVWWWLSHRLQPTVKTQPAVEVTPVAPDNLQQVDAGGDQISEAGATKQTKLTLEFSVDTKANSGSLTPEVELVPVATAFKGEPNLTAQAVTANGSRMQFSVSTDALKDGAYHWQARVSKGDKSSDWVIFGTDATAAAFTVDTVAPKAPTVTAVGGAAVANPTVIQSNRPAFTGTADPGASIAIVVPSTSLNLRATADSSGKWSVTPDTDIPNGQNEVSVTATDQAGNASIATKLTLSINPATAADTKPSGQNTDASSATTAPATSTNSQAATATAGGTAKQSTEASTLAPTGDNTTVVSLLSLAIMIAAAGGLAVMRRRYAGA